MVALLPFQARAQTGNQTNAPANAGVDVWLTTADRSSLFAEQPERLVLSNQEKATPGSATPAASNPASHNSASSNPVIEVAPKQRFQSMDGFGFALTGGSAELLMRMSPTARTALLNELFGTGKNAIGVSYLRVSIGSSDMNARVFTYDDLPPGETDPALAKFTLGPDLKDVVPVLKEILAIDPKIAILGSPWSAPSWLKTNDLPKAGSLLPQWYGTYARYFVRYIQAMAAQGITIRAITMQNEPLNPKNTPSMVISAKEQATFLATALGPAFREAGVKTDVILYDHNCDKPEYPLQVLADPQARKYAKGTGFHLYGGTIDAMTKVHDAYPKKDLYFTEQMVVEKPDKTPFEIARSVSRIVIEAPRNWSRNVLLWNLAADPEDGPHTSNGGCPVCQGAITLDGDTVTRNLAYYTIAQASRFVRPGSVRIASESFGSSSSDMLPNVAYKTPEHTTVLLVANTGAAAQTFSVRAGKKAFTATLGAGDVATYVWK